MPAAGECRVVSDREVPEWESPVSAFLEWLSHLDLPLVTEVVERSGTRAWINLSRSRCDAGVAAMAPQADWLSNFLNGVHSVRKWGAESELEDR